MRTEQVDALIVGGGPIGLLVAVQLRKFSCSALVVERDDKPSMPIYGRATTLWCRTLELLDQLGLAEDLMEEGAVTKDGINFRDGKPAPGGLTFGQVSVLTRDGDRSGAARAHYTNADTSSSASMKKMHKHGDTRFNMSCVIPFGRCRLRS